MAKQKIALFHPWIKSKGGAEKVVLELLKNSKHDYDLYTWIYDKENTFKEFEDYKIKIISPKIGKKVSRKYILRGILPWLGMFKKIPLEKYDKLLISTAGVGELIVFKNYKKGKTYAYVHTPLREADKDIIKWNLENRHGRIKKYVYLPTVEFYNILEKKAWKKLDTVIFNSDFSLSRARKKNLLKNQKVHIVNPVIDISRLKSTKNSRGKDFVYISRFNPPKRQDVLIEAWKQFSKENPGYGLVLIGTPEDKKYYKKIRVMARDDKTITIKENVSDDELRRIMAKAKAGIFLGYQEDFGIVPLEIISSGKPLLAPDKGGYFELIKNHPNFHKIKEKHIKDKMVKEVERALRKFVRRKNLKDKRTRIIKIKTKNFIKEIDNVLES